MVKIHRTRRGVGDIFWISYTPRKRTWISKMPIFERRYLLQTIILGPSMLNFWGVYLSPVGCFFFAEHIGFFSDKPDTLGSDKSDFSGCFFGICVGGDVVSFWQWVSLFELKA